MVTGQLDADDDVVVIGGGAAGLNGALMLARARRRVRVAGNVTDLGAQVGAAASAGATAGAMINADLVEDETRQAVAAVPL